MKKPPTPHYDLAKSGGKHAGFLNNYIDKPPEELRKAIASLERQVILHRRWIKNPLDKIPDFYLLDERRQRNLLEWSWPNDIARHLALIEILNGILAE